MTREDAVMNFIANGELRLSEAARLLAWTRSRMRRHAIASGVDAKAARRAYVAREFVKAAAIGREIEATGKPMREALAEGHGAAGG